MLILLLYILIQVPAVQNFARKKAVAYLEDKLHTKVEINKLSLSFPKSIVLEDVYFEDQHKDTLFSGEKIKVDIALLKLISSKVEINSIELKDIYANIYRTGKDTIFNYQYIVDAFTTPATTTADSSAGMRINVDRIILNNVAASFKDDQTGMDFYGRLGKFETAFKKFDLDQLIFSLPDIALENVSGHFYQNKLLLTPQPMELVEAESNEPFKLQLSLSNISIKNIVFDYRNDISVMKANLNLGELSGKVKSIDLAKLDVQLENIKLHRTTAGIFLGKSDQTVLVKKEINKEVIAQVNNPWKISISNIDLENNNLQFEDDNQPTLQAGMDYGHLKIDSLRLKGNNFVFTPVAYTGSISSAGFREKSGFDLREFKTDFSYSDTVAALHQLYAQTDQTLIRDDISVRYPSLEAVTNDPGKLYLDANFAKSDLAAKDILVFAPQLQPNLKGNENAVLHINARVKGFVNNLAIPALEVSGIGNTMVSMSGNITGLPDVNKTRYDLNIASFKTTKQDIERFVPAGTIPSNIRLPETMQLNGSFTGSATSFTSNVSLQTNKGNGTLNGFLNSANETYDLKGTLNNVDAGYLLKQDTLLGRVTMSFAAKGSGFTPDRLNTNATATIKSAVIKGYNYQQLTATATAHRGFTTLDASMADKSIAFHLNGSAQLQNNSASAVKMQLQLDSLLLKPLGLYAGDLRIHGNVMADVPVASLDAPQGTVQIAGLVVSNDDTRYQADTISIAAASTDTGKTISLNSQIARASLQGRYNLATIGTGALQLINKYYNIGIKDSAVSKDQWKLNAAIIPDSLLFVFAPSLRGTDTIHLKADFDGSTEKINLLVNAPKVQVGEQVLDSLTITAGNPSDKLLYAASVNTAGTKAFRLQKTTLNGFVANNELYSTLNIADIDGKDKYRLGTKISQEQNKSIRAVLSDSLMLNYKNWLVDNSNYILYDSTGIIVHHFDISNSGQLLSVNSTSENKSAPIDIVLKDFHIKTLTNLAEQDSLLLDGVINGKALVKNAITNPVFTADIRVDTLTFNTDTIGNLAVKVDNETANAFTTDVSITGQNNDVKLSGKYYTGESRMDLKLLINNLNMASIRPFTFGNLSQADGSLKGEVSIKGTTTDPDLNGSVHFENASITPKLTGEKLRLTNETILVSSRDISFEKFTLVDSAGNKAVLDGNIFTEDFKTYRFDLDLNADNFRVLTAPPKQNSLYYGDMNMNAAITVKGSLTAPVVNADLKINKSTNITFVLPSSNPEIENRDGVVQFVDVYGGSADSIFKAAIDTARRFPELAGLDLTTTLESDTAAQITLVIDERSGDALKIRGKADLAAGFDKSGKISLTGNYELQNGSYQLSLSLLKRQFIIQPGSVITWTGDPMSATVDISAIYIANTQPVNLLQSELANLSATDAGKYKAKVPFNVVLKMKGELLKPQISFDIQLPDDQKSKWTDVETKLEQVRRDDAELNKQVFALLLLNRFIQENPLENAADATSLASTAKTSVSRILTEQLNNLAGSLIKGVDLNFGVNAEDDYSSGTRTSRTDLTVGVSKRLLNDRLRVSVGSNFELEGPANTNESTSNIAGDVAVDYLLSKDGRYSLRAYRRNHYEGVIEGQVIESGVAFIFTFDFNEFKQIFNRKTEEQKLLEKAAKEKKQAQEEKEKKDKQAADRAKAE